MPHLCTIHDHLHFVPFGLQLIHVRLEFFAEDVSQLCRPGRRNWGWSAIGGHRNLVFIAFDYGQLHRFGEFTKIKSCSINETFYTANLYTMPPWHFIGPGKEMIYIYILIILHLWRFSLWGRYMLWHFASTPEAFAIALDALLRASQCLVIATWLDVRKEDIREVDGMLVHVSIPHRDSDLSPNSDNLLGFIFCSLLTFFLFTFRLLLRCLFFIITWFLGFLTLGLLSRAFLVFFLGLLSL